MWGNVFVGLTVSFFNDTGDATYTASIPDPLFFGRPKTVTGTQTGLKHSEVAYLPELIYSRPVTDKLDVVGKIGPAIINLSQDSISGFTVPAGTQDLIVNTTSQSATGTGINVSFGANYNLTDRYAVGGYLRYAGASVKLDASPDKQDVGGCKSAAESGSTSKNRVSSERFCRPAYEEKRGEGPWPRSPFFVHACSWRAMARHNCRRECPGSRSARPSSVSARRPSRQGCPTAAAMCPLRGR